MPAAVSSYFRVSSGLKKIIGRDLITDNVIAVFELVKNSFDARARRVDLFFDTDDVWVIDNGKGMSAEDIDNKWLFVAYSAKADGTEDSRPSRDYRKRLRKQRNYAGNKGVGRFSCDRLGSRLHLQSKAAGRGSSVEVLDVHWDQFESDLKADFIKIPIARTVAARFKLPKGFKSLTHGTVLRVMGLREPWTRKKLLELRAYLAKLISPFDAKGNKFQIVVHAPGEAKEDAQTEPEHGQLRNERVNGPVSNFIFQDILEKTTSLTVQLKNNGSTLHTELLDRGELIYEIEEKNPYPFLTDTNFSCRLYFLNQSAKHTFTRRMGIESVRFGSVFLFRNGFRVFPIGEENDDSFGLGRRKQQGYARYLGTRDVIGRIDVYGSEAKFRESSSRDKGLIDTPATRELTKCFMEKCLKRLERYVVGVTWLDATDKFRDDIKALLKDRTRASATSLVSGLVRSKSIRLVRYSKRLIALVSQKAENFEKSLEDLKAIAQASGDKTLLKRLAEAQREHEHLRRIAEEAERRAEEERQARERAETEARSAEEATAEAASRAERAEKAYQEERKRNLFLTATSNLDYDTILNLHHQIGIYAADIQSQVKYLYDRVRSNKLLSPSEMLEILQDISFKNQKILTVSRFATKANFRLESEKIEDNLPVFIDQYIREVCQLYVGQGLSFNVETDGIEFTRAFRPMEVSMLIDNLVDNARKARAHAMDVRFSKLDGRTLQIDFSDDGAGPGSEVDMSRIFEKGFTTTIGSGLGLYHAKLIAEDMKGSIDALRNNGRGLTVRVRISK